MAFMQMGIMVLEPKEGFLIILRIGILLLEWVQFMEQEEEIFLEQGIFLMEIV
jgi:hypothetical protein